MSALGPFPKAQADAMVPGLPAAGTMVNLSPAYEPVMIKGLTVYKDNPFLFDFIVDVGQDRMSGRPLKKEGEKLIKYFLASLAIPDKDVWVNLSPYEKNKIIPDVLGQTDMGRDLLEQDYILKQITASLIYPEKDLGKKFWDRVYSKAQEMYGTTQVPVNTFNKVWIMADRAEVFEHNQTAFVVDSHLKVMLEEDYLALQKHMVVHNATDSIGANIVRQIILPELEKEVNAGKNFANLRQIFNSIILASWYKKNLKQALLNQVYANHSRVRGIERTQIVSPEQIYQQYLKAYKKGVFNYIKEEVNSAGATVPRKYFSGGMVPGAAANPAMTADVGLLTQSLPQGRAMIDFATLASDEIPQATKPFHKTFDAAMLTLKAPFQGIVPGFKYGYFSFFDGKIRDRDRRGLLVNHQGQIYIKRGESFLRRYFIQPVELPGAVSIHTNHSGFAFGINKGEFYLYANSNATSIPVFITRIRGRESKGTEFYDFGFEKKKEIDIENAKNIEILFEGQSISLTYLDGSLFLAEPFELKPMTSIAFRNQKGEDLFQICKQDENAFSMVLYNELSGIPQTRFIANDPDMVKEPQKIKRLVLMSIIQTIKSESVKREHGNGRIPIFKKGSVESIKEEQEALAYLVVECISPFMHPEDTLVQENDVLFIEGSAIDIKSILKILEIQLNSINQTLVADKAMATIRIPRVDKADADEIIRFLPRIEGATNEKWAIEDVLRKNVTNAFMLSRRVKIGDGEPIEIPSSLQEIYDFIFKRIEGNRRIKFTNNVGNVGVSGAAIALLPAVVNKLIQGYDVNISVKEKGIFNAKPIISKTYQEISVSPPEKSIDIPVRDGNNFIEFVVEPLDRKSSVKTVVPAVNLFPATSNAAMASQLPVFNNGVDLIFNQDRILRLAFQELPDKMTHIRMGVPGELENLFGEKEVKIQSLGEGDALPEVPKDRIGLWWNTLEHGLEIRKTMTITKAFFIKKIEKLGFIDPRKARLLLVDLDDTLNGDKIIPLSDELLDKIDDPLLTEHREEISKLHNGEHIIEEANPVMRFYVNLFLHTSTKHAFKVKADANQPAQGIILVLPYMLGAKSKEEKVEFDQGYLKLLIAFLYEVDPSNARRFLAALLNVPLEEQAKAARARISNKEPQLLPLLETLSEVLAAHKIELKNPKIGSDIEHTLGLFNFDPLVEEKGGLYFNDREGLWGLNGDENKHFIWLADLLEMRPDIFNKFINEPEVKNLMMMLKMDSDTRNTLDIISIWLSDSSKGRIELASNLGAWLQQFLIKNNLRKFEHYPDHLNDECGLIYPDGKGGYWGLIGTRETFFTMLANLSYEDLRIYSVLLEKLVVYPELKKELMNYYGMNQDVFFELSIDKQYELLHEWSRELAEKENGFDISKLGPEVQNYLKIFHKYPFGSSNSRGVTFFKDPGNKGYWEFLGNQSDYLKKLLFPLMKYRRTFIEFKNKMDKDRAMAGTTSKAQVDDNDFIREQIMKLWDNFEQGHIEWSDKVPENGENKAKVLYSMKATEIILEELLDDIEFNDSLRNAKYKIFKAIELLFDYQGKGLRADAKFYPIHPLQVALNLIENYGITDPELNISAILHDFIEDVKGDTINLQLIEEMFGRRVGGIVESVTNKKLPPAVKEWLIKKIFKKAGIYPEADPEAFSEVMKIIEYQLGVVGEIVGHPDTLIVKSGDFSDNNALKQGASDISPELQARLSSKYRDLLPIFAQEFRKLADQKVAEGMSPGTILIRGLRKTADDYEAKFAAVSDDAKKWKYAYQLSKVVRVIREDFGGLIGLSHRIQKGDFAMSEIPHRAVNSSSTRGGIDLNTTNGMQWKISKDGNGVEMDIDPAMIARVKAEGIDSLSPVVLRMTPVTSIWSVIGLPKK